MSMNAEEKKFLIEPETIQAQKDQQLLALSQKEERLRDWRECVLNTPGGRRIVMDLLGLCKINHNLFNLDAAIMGANCAKNEIGLEILKDIEDAVPGVYARIVREYKSNIYQAKEG